MDERLRYIDAQKLDSPAGRLEGTVLVSPTDGTLGKLDGMVVDPVERQVRYFVIESKRSLTTRHYLVPATPARLEPDRHALHVDFEEDQLEEHPTVQLNALPPFSDEDLIAAMFHHQSA